MMRCEVALANSITIGYTSPRQDVVDQKLKDLMKQLFHDMYVQAKEKHYELMGAANQLVFIRILQSMKLRGLY